MYIIDTLIVILLKVCANYPQYRGLIKKMNVLFTLYMDRERKTRTFRLDEAIIDGLNELAKRKNSSANRLLENMLFEILIKEGVLDSTIEPLGETRGREAK